MLEKLETYLDRFSDFLWEQCEKDIAMSQRVMEHIDHAFARVQDYFRSSK